MISLKTAMDNWQEKKAVIEKQKRLEDRLNRIERDGKRNKIVIRGFEKGTRPAKEAVMTF